MLPPRPSEDGVTYVDVPGSKSFVAPVSLNLGMLLPLLCPTEDGVGEFFFDEDEIMAGLDPETRAAVVAHQLSNGLDLDEGGEEDLQQVGATQTTERLGS